NVNFRSNAKLSFEVNSRLDRKTNSRNDTPRIARLEIVDVNAIAMRFLADGMTGAMRELFAKTCPCDYATRHVIDFRSANRFTRLNVLTHEINRRIARFAHNVE